MKKVEGVERVEGVKRVEGVERENFALGIRQSVASLRPDASLSDASLRQTLRQATEGSQTVLRQQDKTTRRVRQPDNSP
jgi:hypothetical protein